jgi:hypothetical protein
MLKGHAMSKRGMLYCSFCGKDETKVEKLVAGPKVYICDACVAAASRIMDDSSANGDVSPRHRPSLFRRLSSRVLRFMPRGHRRREALSSAM